MVDVGHKVATRRVAVAEARLRMEPGTRASLRDGTKGDAIAVARIAGIQAAKSTSSLIPLCHPLPLSAVSIDLEEYEGGVRIVSRAETTGPTGVEMEALCAASVAALTLYDMLKSVERGMVIEEVALLEKSGGKSGPWTR